MFDPWPGDDEGGTVFRDMITLALAGFVFATLLLLPHINPPGKRAAAGEEPPGNVILEAHWEDRWNTDVDLWVLAPGDVPVGYSNKSGRIFNLLRDDLGRDGDPTEINFETSYSRGIIAGEYTVNLHLYRNKEGARPVPVRVVARVKGHGHDAAEPIAATRVQLQYEGEELTAFRFRLDESGRLVQGSLNSIYRPLRSSRS